MYGWCGRVLRINLTKGSIAEGPLDPQKARLYIGGRGLGISTLVDELDPTCEPLSPENILVMATGPLTGTKAPTGARYVVSTKSPLTGAVTCSNSGGRFPAAMKKAGIDMIVFTGKAPNPVYLWIDRGQAELRSATHLWGKPADETEDCLLEETHGDARVACIGPAGERAVRFASIMNDKGRTAGRSGVGAVAGSKNLKAVVIRGDTPVPLHDEAGFKKLVKELNKKFIAANNGKPPGLRVYGTAAVVSATQELGVLPTRNFQQATFEGSESIDGQALTDSYLISHKACHSCPIGCGRITKVDKARYKGEGEGPEYETIYAMGSNCGVDNLAALIKANYICNEQGMDTITMGCTIACAMELYEKGFIPEADIGRPLNFGDAEALVELTRLTAAGEGFGKLLGEGSLRLAQHYGHPELAMVSKGQEFAGYEPRGMQGMGLAYATSPIGGSHMRGSTAYFELFGVPAAVDSRSTEGKAQIVMDWQNHWSVIDAAGVCVFYAVRNLMSGDLELRPTGLLELINAATGADYSPAELSRAGERIFNAERMFITSAGFSRVDDSLPDRLTREPVPSGPTEGLVCSLEEMLGEYYQLRGWDDNGIPTTAKLKEIDLMNTGK